MQYVFLVLAALLRLVPHPWNVTPIGAIGLFAGTWCDRRIAWLMPLVPLFIGDAVRGFYDPFIMVFVYAGFALSAFIGRWLLSRKRSVMRFGGAIGINAVAFYVVSNVPVWLTYYPRSLAGLAECYLKGLPYLGNMLVGDAVFVLLIFGTHHLARRALARDGIHAAA